MQIKGHFEKIVYYRDDNGYIVAVFAIEDQYSDEDVIVTGYMSQVDRERVYVLEGDYVDHPKYGIQFKIESYQKIIASDEQGLVNYFAGEQFKGIGRKFAQSIVDTLGLDAIDLIKKDIGVLDKVPKMNSTRKQAIVEGLKKETDDDVAFLTSHQVSLKNALRLKNKYGEDLMSVILGNPYQIVSDVSGIGFATIDKFAMSIGIHPDNIYRLSCYCEQLLMELCMRNGDSFLDLNTYIERVEKEIRPYGLNSDDVIENLKINRRIVVEEDRVYHYSQYDSEKYIASYLANFPFQTIQRIEPDVVNANIRDIEEQLGIEYQEKQLEAIVSFFENDFMILTGGPGTGKTTIVRAMIELCSRLLPQYSITLIAPTGRAAKRLNQLTGVEAKTIHSLLLWDKETGKFAKDEKTPLNNDILIIDEFSMVDQYLFYNLLKASALVKKMIIIGDSDQLPSVAMGNVLHDLIDSQLFTTIKLDKIYRQKEGSDIIRLAYDIKNNTLQDIPVDKDIRFFECDPAQIKNLTLQVVDKALASFETLDEGLMNVQVLAPKHMGLNGINGMNVMLQNEFNPASPKKPQITLGYRTFRLGDKVLQLKNQPDDDVYNGDIGIVVEVIEAKYDMNNQNRLIVDFDGRIVEYTSETFSNLTHAYCMSVHKAQGSEYPIIILPMSKEYGIMLQKRLIYTAVTRAYKSLIFIGQKEAFYRGIQTLDHYYRKTTLKEKLVQQFDKENSVSEWQ